MTAPGAGVGTGSTSEDGAGADSMSEEDAPLLGRDARIAVFCWRGGERSGSLAHTLSRVGWHVAVVRGGYRAYRAAVRDALCRLDEYDYVLVGGPTGVGKGRLLDALRDAGAQVIDLERLANHRGSILGDEPDAPQPTQKAFESNIIYNCVKFDPSRPIYLEAESSLIGRLQLPPSLFRAMQAAPYVEVALPLAARVRWIRSQYAHFETTHVPQLLARLEMLRKSVGGGTVERWAALIAARDWTAFVESILLEHYDPVYRRALRRDRERGGAPPHGDGGVSARDRDRDRDRTQRRRERAGARGGGAAASSMSALPIDDDDQGGAFTSRGAAAGGAAAVAHELRAPEKARSGLLSSSEEPEFELGTFELELLDDSDEEYRAAATRLLAMHGKMFLSSSPSQPFPSPSTGSTGKL